jgi:aspartyl/asparaginyl-tRNA synthetase
MAALDIPVPAAVPAPVRPVEKTFLADLPGRVGDRVVTHGWIDGIRRSRAVTFVSLRDRSASVQVVCRPPVSLAGAPAGSAVRVTGQVRPCAAARYGPVEIEAEVIDVVAPATAAVPSLDGAGIERRADLRHLELRSRSGALRYEVQTTLVTALRDELLARSFLELHTPRISAGGSESGAATFALDHLGTPACLAQSPQFALQLAMAAGLDRVFEVGPVFRAEACTTNRHASEFTSVDVELSWIGSEHELMDLEEALLRAALGAVRDRHGREVEQVFGVPVEVPETDIPRLDLARVAAVLGDDRAVTGRLTHRDEQALCKHARRLSGHSLVFVTGYPERERPFYTHHDGAGGTRSFDLLWGGMEVSSGCQREHREDRLRAQAAAAGLGSDALARFLDRHWLPMFGHGCPPHGGFGLGLDRLLMAVCGLGSIREASFLYRGPGRSTP